MSCEHGHASMARTACTVLEDGGRAGWKERRIAFAAGCWISALSDRNYCTALFALLVIV